LSDIKESIEYSFGFEGYLDHLDSLHQHIREKNISFAEFIVKKDIKEQHIDKEDIKEEEKDKNNVDKNDDDIKEQEEENKKTTLKNQYYPCILRENPVKNDISLKQNIILTGPNASGKTTLLKTTALNVIFSQQFGCGFYDAATIQPYTHIDSYLNIPDTSERDSLFQAESRRCKDILEKISDSSENDHHLCIFDELYSGTNCEDAVETATAFLKYLSSLEKVDFVLPFISSKVFLISSS
jgi:hypothetical protein